METRYSVQPEDYGWVIIYDNTTEVAVFSQESEASYVASVLEQRRDTEEIVITTSMLEAGIKAIEDAHGTLRSARKKQELVDAVYRAMRSLEGGKRAFR